MASRGHPTKTHKQRKITRKGRKNDGIPTPIKRARKKVVRSDDVRTDGRSVKRAFMMSKRCAEAGKAKVTEGARAFRRNEGMRARIPNPK